MFAVHQMPNFTSPAVSRPRQDRICIFEKFSTCKNGDNCNFKHPTLVCDDQKNCDITLCNKRHPQVCLHDTIFKNCMNDGICRFHHRNNDSNECVDDDKYRDLEVKYNSLLDKLYNMERRIEILENEKKSSQNEEMQSSRSRSLIDINRTCTRSRSQGDVKRKLDDVKENTSEKKNKIDEDTLVSDDNSIVTKMEEDVEEVQDNEVSYNVFYKNVEKELQNIKTSLGKEKKMTVKSVQRIKGMLKNIGKDYKFSKRTENMKRRSQVFSNNFEKTYDKIEKTENSKFRDVTSAEIKKLIFMCKSEQNIIN